MLEGAGAWPACYDRAVTGRPHLRSLRSLRLAAALLVAAAGPAAATTPATTPAGAGTPVPRLAYDTFLGDEPVAVVASLHGDVTARFEDAEPFLSITGGLVAVARRTYADPFRADVTVADAATGEVRQVVPDARYPLLFDGGDALLFLPDNQGVSGDDERDPYVNSVWYRDLTTGAERRLAQFTDGDFRPLHLAASPTGRRVAFTVGDDTGRFEWDVWAGPVDGPARPVTDDGQSLYPSFSPDGRSIAYTHQERTDGCSTEVRVMDADGGRQRTLAAGSCARSLIRPVWLDRETIVAWQYTGDETGFRPSGLVTVDVATGAVDTVVTGRVFDFSVSRTLHVVAFRTVDGRIAVWDPATGKVRPVAGAAARPGGHLHVDGALEQAV